MKLYYSPGAGALASNITSRELDLDVEIVKVDVVHEHQTEKGEDYYQINPKGYVPYLKIDTDNDLSEGAAILQYLADRKPEGKMIAAEGTIERYKIQEWMTFVGTELQQMLGSFFVTGHVTDTGLQFTNAKLNKRLTIIDEHLKGKEFLVGDRFTIADAYAFTIMNWVMAFGLPVDLTNYAHLNRYFESVKARESVQIALKEEGLA